MRINRYNLAMPLNWYFSTKLFHRNFRITKILMIFFVIPCNMVCVYAQKISIHQKNVPLAAILKEIKTQSGYGFIYDAELINQAKKVSVDLHNAELDEALKVCFLGQPLTYSISNKTIIIREMALKNTKRPQYIEDEGIKGRVVTSDGIPVFGASVSIKDKKKGTKTNERGEFSISDVEGTYTLIVSHIGYETREITVTGKETELIIKMVLKENKIEDVVVTGMFERRKESFTGVTATIKGDQLRTVGNQNVIQALRSLDPSFIILDNNLQGSDPNALARIELRGKTSITKIDNTGTLLDQISLDPNMPLFILDGFESSLRQITDLDINRIASITILKDAASTALYGARSANGVIVVETIKPKAGELRINYTADFNTSVPDLNDYNLMNAEEKLEFERLAGRYDSKAGGFEDYQILEQFYNQRLKAVKEGVNSYWLNEPLRTLAFNQNHSIYASGGSDAVLYGVGTNYQNISGVMKGSGRKNWGARVDLTYRTKKVNVTNRTFISGSRADESVYGSFSTYANMNPYYKKGITDRYVESVPFSDRGIIRMKNEPNLLYNSKLNSEQYTTNLLLQNNLGFNYDVNTEIRFSGGFQLVKNIGNSVDFISPLHTKFDNSPQLQKGSYTSIKRESFNYSGNVSITYNKILGTTHVLTGNARAEVQQLSNSAYGFMAVGFPLGVKGNPGFANSYQPNSKPLVSTPPITRRVNALISLNYSYDNRYFVDATYRVDGSTAFGSARKYSPFWSAGIGWSVHNEKFLKESDWLSSLILRANIGSTGNQNFGSFASATVYYLESNTNYFGQGLYHTSLGNPNLDWQKTFQTSVGIDMGILKNRFTANLNVYEKYTNPLIVNVLLPGSNGVTDYAMNTGSLTMKGLEIFLNYSPILRPEKRINWTVGLNGSIYKGRYGKFGNSLNGLNAEQMRNNSIQRFADGRSPDDIWAYKSIGIDPGSGREVFLNEGGDYVFDYQQANIQVVGNSRPLSEGVINSNLRIKNFTFSTYIRYNLGASRLNTALYNKVENISFDKLSFNQDKRALQERWKNPGDIARFKGISLTDYTPISSRFVQKENIFSGESISMGYELLSSEVAWLKSAHLRSLRFSAYMNNIFRISNIVAERGINYPFARTVSCSINASF